jgi:predicted phosphodiesterase
MKKVLIIPDTHIPYHDKRAFDTMLQAGKAFKPTDVIILGDFVDFYAVSSHNKDPKRALELKNEITETIKALELVKGLGATNNVFIAGNHEDRLTRYLQQKAPELYDIINIPSVLELNRIGFKYVPYRQHYNIGKLYATHDVGSAGESAIKRAAEAFKRNIITGHTHRLASIVQSSVEGVSHMSASFGWLGDKKEIDYLAAIKVTKDWQLGFGIAYIDEKTDYCYITPVPIIDYTCVIEGKLIKGRKV